MSSRNGSGCIAIGSKNWNVPAIKRTGRARHFHAVEPENRLVGRELERRWEEALHEQRRLEEEYDRFARAQPATLSAAEREQIRSLAQAIPALWQAVTTTPADRQRLVRFLIERIELLVHGDTDQVEITIHWTGGFVSQHSLVRAVQRYDQLADYGRLRARIEELRAQGQTMAQVAQCLNQEGFHPPKQRSASRWTWSPGSWQKADGADRDRGRYPPKACSTAASGS